MTVKHVECYNITCDTYPSSKLCRFSCSHDMPHKGEARRLAKEEGWEETGNQVEGFRHRCPECVNARARLEKR